MTWTPIIVAHRGLHDRRPENSLAAFEAAFAAGFWVECDVQFSRDGVPVVIHDETLDRTAEGCGRIDERDCDSLSRTRLRGSNQTIPTLSDALQLDPAGNGWLVEIKPVPGPEAMNRLVEALARAGRRWMLQSFHADNILALRGRASSAWLIDKPEDLERAALVAPAAHVQHRLLSEATCRRLRSEGLRIGTWTVNEAADIARVVELRPDMIISDAPQRVRDATESFKSGR